MKIPCWLQEQGIKQQFSYSVKKNPLIEREIKKMKTRLYRYMFTYNSKEYVSQLQQIAHGLNNTVHSTTGFTPLDALKEENRLKVFKNAYFPKSKGNAVAHEPHFAVGDKVLVAHTKHPFKPRSFYEQFSSEVFTIHQVVPGSPHQYVLRDDENNVIRGYFYGNQLKKSPYPFDTSKRIIESIVGRRHRLGRTFYLVRFQGLDKSFDTWMPQEQYSEILNRQKANKQ